MTLNNLTLSRRQVLVGGTTSALANLPDLSAAGAPSVLPRPGAAVFGPPKA